MPNSSNLNAFSLHSPECIFLNERESESRIRLFAIPWTIQSMEFSRPEYCSGQPLPSPGDLSNPGIEPRSPALQVDSLPAEPPGKPKNTAVGSLSLLQGIVPTQGSNPVSPTLRADSLPAEPPGKPKNTGVGSLSLLQGIFPTQESNQGLLHYKWILWRVTINLR